MTIAFSPRSRFELSNVKRNVSIKSTPTMYWPLHASLPFPSFLSLLPRQSVPRLSRAEAAPLRAHAAHARSKCQHAPPKPGRAESRFLDYRNAAPRSPHGCHDMSLTALEPHFRLAVSATPPIRHEAAVRPHQYSPYSYCRQAKRSAFHWRWGCRPQTRVKRGSASTRIFASHAQPRARRLPRTRRAKCIFS